MKKYLTTLLEEKNISLEAPLEINGKSGINFMSVGILVEAIITAPKNEQVKIKDILIKIDFKNGDIMHFLKHLAKALAI